MKHNKIQNDTVYIEYNQNKILEQISAAIDEEDSFPDSIFDSKSNQYNNAMYFFKIGTISSYALKNSQNYSYSTTKSNLANIMNSLEQEPSYKQKLKTSNHSFKISRIFSKIKIWVNIALPTAIMASFISVSFLSDNVNNISNLQSQNINAEKYIKAHQNSDDFMNTSSNNEDEEYIDSSMVANLY